jgi:hypothetical protein
VVAGKMWGEENKKFTNRLRRYSENPGDQVKTPVAKL